MFVLKECQNMEAPTPPQFFMCTPSIFNLTLTAGGGQRLRETSPAQSGDSREPGTKQLPLQDH